jgi:hypothetical protein
MNAPSTRAPKHGPASVFRTHSPHCTVHKVQAYTPIPIHSLEISFAKRQILFGKGCAPSALRLAKPHQHNRQFIGSNDLSSVFLPAVQPYKRQRGRIHRSDPILCI